MDNDLKKVESDIKEIRLQLETYKHFKAKQKVLLGIISAAQAKAEKLKRDKYSFINMSLESLCGRVKRRFLIRKCVEILEKPDLIENVAIIDDLAVLIDDEDSRIDEKVIRDLARSQPFRGMWKTSQETGTSLLNHSTSEMTDL